MKIIHTPYNEANNPYTLSRAERELGLYSNLEILQSDPYFNNADRNWSNGSFLVTELMRWPLIVYVLLKYDVIHYNFGSYIAPSVVGEQGKFSFLKKLYNVLYARPLEGIDVKMAHFLGKKILVTFQGSDGRLIEYCQDNYKWHFSKEKEFNYNGEDNFRISKIELFDRYNAKIFTVNPDLLNTLPEGASFIPYSSVYPSKVEPHYPELDKEQLEIVHAPSNRTVKGTRYILKAVEKLKEEGVKFNLTLVEGYTNEEALEIYKKADIIIDQLLAGWYGAFALEAMAMGKPVMCYVRESDLVHIPKQMKADLPIINVNPSTITSQLRYYLEEGRNDLKLIGVRSREYACKWHSPIDIAKKIMEELKK